MPHQQHQNERGRIAQKARPNRQAVASIQERHLNELYLSIAALEAAGTNHNLVHDHDHNHASARPSQHTKNLTFLLTTQTSRHISIFIHFSSIHRNSIKSISSRLKPTPTPSILYSSFLAISTRTSSAIWYQRPHTSPLHHVHSHSH